MAVSLWFGLPTLPAEGLSWTLPLAHRGELTFTLWTHDLAFSEAYTTGGLTRQRPGPLRLTIWGNPAAAGVWKRLVVVKVPAWPLVLAGATLATTGAWLWLAASPILSPCPRSDREMFHLRDRDR